MLFRSLRLEPQEELHSVRAHPIAERLEALRVARGVNLPRAGVEPGVIALVRAGLVGVPCVRTAGIAPYTSGSNYTLSVLPMFILIGYLAYYAGITQTAFEAARRWFGWLPGGLATGTVFAVAGFSAVSGASSAAAAVFAKVAIPEMLRAKYDKKLAAGICAAGATLDSLIPPSTLLVVYGIVTEQSIGKLLIAGFVPGIFSAFVYALIITYRCWRNPELGPRITGYTWPQRFTSLPPTAAGLSAWRRKWSRSLLRAIVQSQPRKRSSGRSQCLNP